MASPRLEIIALVLFVILVVAVMLHGDDGAEASCGTAKPVNTVMCIDLGIAR